MSEFKKITISGLNYPGKKFIKREVMYVIKDNIVYVNGKKFFSGIKVKIDGNKANFFDKSGYIDRFNHSVEEFIQQVFSDKYYKFKGNLVVNCFTCSLG